MPSSAKLSTKEITLLGLLLSGAIALRLLEGTFAYLLPFPGAHLGLANCLTIMVLYLFGAGKAGLFLLARIILVGLLFTGLFTPGFLIGLGGAILSFLAMAIARDLSCFSPIGIGVLGAFCHNLGQICVAIYIMHTAALLSYLPLLILLGIPTGIFTGLLAKLALQRLSRLN